MLFRNHKNMNAWRVRSDEAYDRLNASVALLPASVPGGMVGAGDQLLASAKECGALADQCPDQSSPECRAQRATAILFGEIAKMFVTFHTVDTAGKAAIAKRLSDLAAVIEEANNAVLADHVGAIRAAYQGTVERRPAPGGMTVRPAD
jgi:hypothetical protein